MSRSRLSGAVSARNSAASTFVGRRPAMSTMTRRRKAPSSHRSDGAMFIAFILANVCRSMKFDSAGKASGLEAARGIVIGTVATLSRYRTTIAVSPGSDPALTTFRRSFSTSAMPGSFDSKRAHSVTSSRSPPTYTAWTVSFSSSPLASLARGGDTSIALS